jgi:uncharacterized protein YqeY
MLIDQIKADQLRARKDRKTVPNNLRASLLTTLYSEAAMVGKNDGGRVTTDQEVVTVVKKFLKGVEETLAASNGVNTTALYEKQVLMSYLPTQMTDEDLGNAIDEIITNNGFSGIKQMGLVMKELKAAHGGLFDGKVASILVKAKL